MFNTVISNHDEPEVPVTPATTEKTPTTQPTADELAALRAENESLRGRVLDSERTAGYWHGRASSTPAPPAAAAAEPEEEDVDVLDLLTTKGAKGLDEILAKRGYVRASEVDAKVNTKAAELASENNLMRAYPELADPKSDFFKAAAIKFGELQQMGVPRAVATRMAAESTELEMLKAGKKAAPATAADTKASREAERQARIKAQTPDRNPRTAESEEGDDELTEAELRICQGMEITPEAYIARAKKGVSMSIRNNTGAGGIRTGRK